MTVGSAACDSAVRAEIEAMLIEHSWLIDHGHANQIGALYTEDAELLLPDDPRRGRAAITAWGLERVAERDRLTRHVHGNLRLIALGPHEVAGTLTVVVYRTLNAAVFDPGPATVAEYEDEYLRVDGHWRIRSRRIAKIFWR
jgi:SnoaL-like domain